MGFRTASTVLDDKIAEFKTQILPTYSETVMRNELAYTLPHEISWQNEMAVSDKSTAIILGVLGGAVVPAIAVGAIAYTNYVTKQEQAVLQSWQSQPSVTIKTAHTTFASQPEIAAAVSQCAEHVLSSQKPAAYTLQPDGTLQASAHIVPAAQVQQQFTACVEQDLRPVNTGVELSLALPFGLTAAAMCCAAYKYAGVAKQSRENKQFLQAQADIIRQTLSDGCVTLSP